MSESWIKGDVATCDILKPPNTLARILRDIADKLPACILDMWQKQWLTLSGYPITSLADGGRKAQRAQKIGVIEWIQAGNELSEYSLKAK